MKTLRYVISVVCLFLASTLPLQAQQEQGEQMKRYADEYAKCMNADSRLHLANDFFAYLLKTDYIDEPISFPDDAHIDSVDLNVYFYVAEFFYGNDDYQTAEEYCTRAMQACTDHVDDVSKSDVYGLLAAVYFRQSAFDKAVEILNQCYELDKKTGDFDRMSSTLNSIASIFVAAGKPDEAEKYILEAFAVNSLTGNLPRRAVFYGTASELYRSMNDIKQSLEYARKALDTELQIGDSARIGIRLSQLASVQLAALKVDDARRSLEEAIPLLLKSGNMHSWGICQNQMGDILANEDKNDEAADCYLEAAKLFLKQGDMYNELHAREGLYKVTKDTAPNEAMMHIERAKQLKDSIYQNETTEALAKYNAIYYNDILQKEKERTERRERAILLMVIIALPLLLALIGLTLFVTLRRHKQKVDTYEQHISSMQDQVSEINRQYQNVLADMMQIPDDMTEDDKQFVVHLTNVISQSVDEGVTEVEKIASRLHLSSSSLHRRLTKIMSITPKTYILRVRMHKAKFLLQNYRDITIADVAYKCGYSQMGNFTRAFKNYYGVPPSDLKDPKVLQDLKAPKDLKNPKVPKDLKDPQDSKDLKDPNQ